MNQAHKTEHLMRLDKIHPSGAEEWCCIYCERRVMKQHEPAEQEIILDAGISNGEHADDIIETEISNELWLAVQDVLNHVEMDW
jgi:hypothetical protein